MKSLNLIFQIHQPYRLKRYRFFDIGNDHYYYDDFSNESIFRAIAERSYRPAINLLKDALAEYPGFKCSLSVSGVAIEQMEYYSPDLLQEIGRLVDTGRVEILAGTYSHSLSSIYDLKEWKGEVRLHTRKIEQVFDYRPRVLINTELIYSDDIAEAFAEMEFDGIITEGARHILGWKSRNYVYRSTVAPEIKVLLRNAFLSDAVANYFSRYDHPDYPMTADKYIGFITSTPDDEKLFTACMPIEVMGTMQNAATGIFDFFRALPRIAKDAGVTFCTPSEAVNTHKPVDGLTVIYPISRMGEEKDITPWCGNELQRAAQQKLADIGERVRIAADPRVLQDWIYLQSSDHFLYMSTKSDITGFSPYESPYDAFSNYMNVFSDFILRVEALYPEGIENEELSALLLTIRNQDRQIEKLKQEVQSLRPDKTTGMVTPINLESK